MAGLDPSPPGRPKAKYNGSAPASEDRARRRAGALRSWTESGRLPYWPRKPPLARSIWVFLDHRGFAPHGPKTRLGFPWISLDSLVRIENFKWVTPDFWREKISRALLPLDSALGQEPVFLRCRTQCRSSSKPNSFSAFLQSIAERQKCRFFLEPRTGRQ